MQQPKSIARSSLKRGLDGLQSTSEEPVNRNARPGLKLLARISHDPVRNPHSVPKSVGANRESFRPGKLLPKQLLTGELLTSSKTCEKFRLVALCLGFLGLAGTIANATNTTERPAKKLDEANDSIHWPEGFTPQQADSFVHNQIFIKAPARVIWSNLVAAVDWPSWYSNSADVQIMDADEGRLGPKSQFNWKTLGFPVTSRVYEFVPSTRLAWFGDGTGIRAYHAWLIIEKSDGCEVVTEETQNGPSAIKFNLNQPSAMYDAHDWWLNALKVRSERAAGNNQS